MAREDEHSHSQRVLGFHARRLYEISQYEVCLHDLVFVNPHDGKKEALSDRRLLKQPTSYQVLTLIWSQASVGLQDEEPDVLTAYGLSAQIARSSSADVIGRTVNYVTRVAHAANRCGLVKIGDEDERRRRPIESTPLLDTLMVQFAERCSKMQFEPSESNANT